jgi:ribose transport system substrate-binding protein
VDPQINNLEDGVFMKKAICLLLSIVLFVSLALCVGASDSDPKPRIKLSIAYCLDAVDVSLKKQFETAQAYADWLTRTRDDLEIEMLLFDAQWTVETQIANIETAVAMGVDAIILSPVDPDGVKPAAMAAMAAGVPILDRRNTKYCTVTFISAQEEVRGERNRDWIKGYLQDNPDVVLNAGLQLGSVNTPASIPRLEKVLELEQEFPGRFNVLEYQHSDWSAETSMKMVEDWLQIHPDMNFISAASEEQMKGCIEALRGAGVLDKFVLTCFNGEQPGVDMLKKGEINMDVGVIMPVFAGMTVEYAIKMVLEGFTGVIDASEYTLYIVTQDNVDEYQKKILVDYDNTTYFESQLKDSYLQ